MKVVIISQKSYPYISPRANRATELAKELSRQGHRVILYALTGSLDYSDFHKEYGVEVKSLGVSRFGLSNNEGVSRRNVLYKVIERYLGRFLEFPSCELINMTFRALKKERQIDMLITIAVPHTIHWGAAKFRKKYPGSVHTWIADCGDPFMLNPFLHKPWYFKYVEKNWCHLCDFITVPIDDAIKAYYPEFAEKIKVIPQGFNFDNNTLANYIPNSIPTFGFAGLFYEKLRDPQSFFDYLSSLNCDFRFVIYIKDTTYYRSAFHLDDYQKKLGSRLVIHNFIPRNELLYQLSKMDFLINIRNDSGVQQPSKLIDYAITGRPILEISSSFKEIDLFNQFLKGDYHHQIMIDDISQYDIRNVVKAMIALTNK